MLVIKRLAGGLFTLLSVFLFIRLASTIGSTSGGPYHFEGLERGVLIVLIVVFSTISYFCLKPSNTDPQQ